MNKIELMCPLNIYDGPVGEGLINKVIPQEVLLGVFAYLRDSNRAINEVCREWSLLSREWLREDISAMGHLVKGCGRKYMESVMGIDFTVLDIDVNSLDVSLLSDARRLVAETRCVVIDKLFSLIEGEAMYYNGPYYNQLFQSLNELAAGPIQYSFLKSIFVLHKDIRAVWNESIVEDDKNQRVALLFAKCNQVRYSIELF